MLTRLAMPFADGEYSFHLGMAQIVAIEEKCGGIGIGEVAARICAGRFGNSFDTIGSVTEGRYRISDIVEVIRQGLIGGGYGEVDGVKVEVNDVRANALIKAWVLAEDRPLEDSWKLATAICVARINGYKPPAETTEKKSPETAADDTTGG